MINSNRPFSHQVVSPCAPAYTGCVAVKMSGWWLKNSTCTLIYLLDFFTLGNIYIGAHAKIWNPTTTPSGVLATAARRKEMKKYGMFAQNRLFRGVGGVPEIFFSLECLYFCELGGHAKN